MWLTCFSGMAQEQKKSLTFPRMFLSAQVGLGWPSADFKSLENAERGQSLVVEYAVMRRYVGVGVLFMQGKHTVTVDEGLFVYQQFYFSGALQKVNEWEYKAFLFGPVISAPFGHKHPGAFSLKLQGGLLRVKAPTIFYENATLFSAYDSAFGLAVGAGVYWSLFKSVAFTATMGTLQSKVGFSMPTYISGFGFQGTTRKATNFYVARLGVGLLFWI